MIVGNGLVSYMTSIAVRLRQWGSPTVTLISPDSNMTRKSIHRIMNTAIGRGGEASPSPGRNPAGAKGMQRIAVSSMSRSSWAGVNTRQVVTKDTKISQQAKSAMRGHRFRTTATAAMKPLHERKVIISELVPNQNRLGARMRASSVRENAWCSCVKNSASGAMPCGPTSAWPSRIIPAKMKR